MKWCSEGVCGSECFTWGFNITTSFSQHLSDTRSLNFQLLLSEVKHKIKQNKQGNKILGNIQTIKKTERKSLPEKFSKSYIS